MNIIEPNKLLWEEKNLIDHNRNLTTNGENVNCDTTTKIKNELISNEQKDTTIKSGIYKIVNKIDGKYYVGKASDFKNRWAVHKFGLKRNIHSNIHLQRAWNKYGQDSFEFYIVEYITPIMEELKLAEQRYLNIAKTDSLNVYNMSFVSGINNGMLGRTASPETRQKMKFAHKGTRGLKHSIETKLKIGIASKGRYFSPETRLKMSKLAKDRLSECDYIIKRLPKCGKTIKTRQCINLFIKILEKFMKE
jgi:group I intron endonuclease